jgi:septal ring factor EnvC (AmiA/AmiB activator)
VYKVQRQMRKAVMSGDRGPVQASDGIPESTLLQVVKDTELTANVEELMTNMGTFSEEMEFDKGQIGDLRCELAEVSTTLGNAQRQNQRLEDEISRLEGDFLRHLEEQQAKNEAQKQEMNRSLEELGELSRSMRHGATLALGVIEEHQLSDATSWARRSFTHRGLGECHARARRMASVPKRSGPGFAGGLD